MRDFMDRDFLLSNDVSKHLFHDFAEKMPILDYHCHIDPREIAEDRKFENITQVWLGGDHYKWRQMRSNGVEEKYITGDASDYEKFEKWAETLEKLIGNPLYHWSHLELQRYFDYHKPLSSQNAKEVWDICNEKLADDSMSARNIIKNSGVTLICTTDDPADNLEYHQIIADDKDFQVQVLPAFRPDRAMNIEKLDYLDYLKSLEAAAGHKIHNFSDLQSALIARIDFFHKMGCVASDHALEYVMFYPADQSEIDMIFNKRIAGEAVTKEEAHKFKTAFMIFVGREYAKREWAMQLHFGCKRDNNSRAYEALGADTGFDSIDNYAPSAQMADFLNALAMTDELPKTILYSLNPNDNAAIGTIIGCFQGEKVAGKIQHGSAWWFNDHKTGMIEQLTSLANLGILSNFIGMLTDSRSLLSYTRHEYFRRILCDLIGTWVDNGEYPADMDALENIIKGISYNNAVSYFALPL